MGDAAGELAHRLELLGLAQLFFGLLAPRDVMDDGKSGTPVGEIDFTAAYLDADGFAAAGAVLVFPLFHRRRIAVRSARGLGLLLSDLDVGNPHRQELFA